MIILGIDPGVARMGYGFIEIKKKGGKLKTIDYGCVITDSNQSAGKRLKKINNELNKLIKKYQPEVLITESLYFFKNLKTAISVSQAGGVILMTAAKKNIPVYELTPLQVKLIISGFGRSEKEIVHKKIKKMLRLKEVPKSDDAADALAIALAFCLQSKKQQKKSAR